MLVKEWMTKELITVEESVPMMKAIRIMKDNNIRRLPVVKDRKVIGIITDRDLREASPSKATTLDIHELYYLLSDIKVKDLMTRNPITIGPDESVEKAAVLMLNYKITGLPVVDETKNLVGIITDIDIFRVLTNVSGIYQGRVKIALDLPEIPGTTQAVINVIRSFEGRIMSVMTSPDVSEEGHRHVYIRIKDIDEEKLNDLIQELNKHFLVSYVVKDVIEGV